MRPQLPLIGIWTLCIAVTEANPFHGFAETIAPGMPHLMRTTQSHIAGGIQSSLKACGQASNKTDINRAMTVSAVLSAPLQVVIVRRLLGSHRKHISVPDKDIAQKSIQCHHHLDLHLNLQVPSKAHAPRVWIIICTGTLSCLTLTFGLLGFVRVSSNRRVSKKRRWGEVPRMTVPRGENKGRAATHNWGRAVSQDDSDGFESLPPHQRSVSDGGNPCGLVSGARNWKRHEIARHLRITGLDRQPPAPIGVVTDAVGIVKDRCAAINHEMKRNQCTELRALADQIQNEAEKEGHMEEMSREFEQKGTCHEKQHKPVQFRGFNEEYLERGSARRMTYAEGTLPHFGRTVSEPEAFPKAQHDLISRLIAG